MIYPICLYGSQVLRQKAALIDKNYDGLQQLIRDMFLTLEKVDGVGLAAPQIGKSIQLFIVNGAPLNDDKEDKENLKEFKNVFINPIILEESGEIWTYNEGCLSVPEIREDVKRKSKIHITYYDENFLFHDEFFEGTKARIIQHEYDHLQGILIVDYMSPLRRRMLKAKLTSITKGNVNTKYKVTIQ